MVIEHPKLEKVLESAAKLQKLIPGAVLVGGSAAAFYAHHRLSYDHDHVLMDLEERFDTVFTAISSDEGWSTFKAIEGKVILGNLDGIEAGIRQLRRAKPLEVEQFSLVNGEQITVPTLEETLRIKAYFICNRNQVRDYLDVVALTDTMPIETAARVLLSIDDYYQDLNRYENTIATELAERLAMAEPRDIRTIAQLSDYKGLAPQYQNWETIREKCLALSKEMIKNA